MFADVPPITTDHPTMSNPGDERFSDLMAGDIHHAKFKFEMFMFGLDILPYLTVTQTRIHSYALHCPSLLAKVGKSDWATPQAARSTGGRLIVADPTLFYDVHMEVAVKPGLFLIEVLVHHETSPFLTEGKLRSLVDHEVAERYRRRRNEFGDEFARQCCVPAFVMVNRWMLVGKAVYNYAGKTVTQASEWLSRTIDSTADAINWTMHKLDARARFIAECDVDSAEVAEAAGIVSPSVVGPCEHGPAVTADNDAALNRVIEDECLAEHFCTEAAPDAGRSPEEVPFPMATAFDGSEAEPCGMPAIVANDGAPPSEDELLPEGAAADGESVGIEPPTEADPEDSDVDSAIADFSATEEVPFPPEA